MGSPRRRIPPGAFDTRKEKRPTAPHTTWMPSARTAVAVLSTLLTFPTALAQAPAPPEPAPAQPQPAQQAPAAQGKEPATQAEVQALAEELRRLKLEIGIPDLEYKSWAGMGPAASKVYYQPKGLAIGGYGEITYADYLDDRTDQTDVLRLVLYAGYRFSRTILFNSEIGLEHGGREVGVEFAYLDFLLSDLLRLRVGNVLVPLGFVNEMHEPPFFNGVFRPEVERNLIPSTWHENGIGLYGEVAGLRYKAYLLGGLDVLGAEPLTAPTWLRRARTDGFEAPAESWAGVLSLSYDLGPALLAAAVYGGRAGQGARDAAGQPIRAEVLIAETHAALAWRGLQLRALYVMGTLGDAGRISAALGLSGTAVIGSRVQGGYLEAGYDLFSALAPEWEQSLTPFVRLEAMNLHDQVPQGGVRDPALDTATWTSGLGYKPIPNVVAKADYQRKTSQAAGAAPAEQVNLGIGLVF